jgi:uncharacterized LabA/DUF88 family protein
MPSPQAIPPPATPSGTPSKQAITFFDGQNLFYAAREAFGYKTPNYDPLALSGCVCRDCGWQLKQVRFYTGVPGHQEDPDGYGFWTAKLQGLRNARVEVFQRPLRYRQRKVRLPLTFPAGKKAHFLLPDGTPLTAGTKLYLPDGTELPSGTELVVRLAEEKGIDVRLALDLIDLTLKKEYDVAILFTQDQDLSEAAREVRLIAQQQQRRVEICSAFPEGTSNSTGVQGTTWIKIDGATYAACLDPRDYGPGRGRRR